MSMIDITLNEGLLILFVVCFITLIVWLIIKE